MITEEQANQIICAIFNDNYLGEYGEGDVVFKVRTGKGYWRSSKYLYVCNNNTIYLLGSDAGIHHITEELPSNLEAKLIR